MRGSLLSTVLVVAANSTLLAACSNAAPPPQEPKTQVSSAPTTAAPSAPAVEMAAAPYTAAEIRDNWPTGKKVVFRVVEDGKPETVRTVEFVKSDSAGAQIRMTETDTKGAVIRSGDSTATWEELRSHGEFPKDKTTVTQRTTVSPMGTLECTVYKVEEGEGQVHTYHFAKKFPGPPVLHFVEKGDKRIMTATMESAK
ncbi:MAG: hypothetical protein IPK82_16395 [Polyangiaceae bacterium]|nr:hypothetical protein [Polyangiaceae bacterium]